MTQFVPHYIHVYQKPKLGSGFIKRHLALNYKHKISAMGWFDTATCHLLVTRTEAERLLEQYVGNRVAVYVDNPVEPIWEGLINTVTYSIGGVQFRRSLDDMYNRVRVNWDRNVGGTLASPTTTAANDTASQAIYGIKEGMFKGKFHRTTPQANSIDRLRDRYISEIPWPQTSATLAQSQAIIALEMVGFYHTLEWEFNTVNVNENTFPTTILTSNILPNIANGATFFDNTDTSGIDTPGVTVVAGLHVNAAETWWRVIQSACEYGDSATLWIAGIEPTHPGTGTRRIYYRASNRDLKYTSRVADNLRIRNPFGGVERPWAVTPDGVIRLSDVLVGWSSTVEDPRETYMMAIDYDANSQRVTWTGEDNASVDGVFKLFRSQQQFSQRFGQPFNKQAFS